MLRDITDDDHEKIRQLYKQGLGAATISRQLKTKCSQVEKFLRENNLMRERVQGLRLRHGIKDLRHIPEGAR
jgi:hypothetical protein